MKSIGKTIGDSWQGSLVTKEEQVALIGGVFQQAVPMVREAFKRSLWTCGTVKGWRNGVYPKRKLTEMTSLRSAVAREEAA